MEENVNKVSSWEDVLADNYNAEPQAEQAEETVEPTGEEIATGDSTNTDDSLESETVSQDDNLSDYSEQSNLSDDDYANNDNEEVSVNSSPEFDEDALYEYLTLKKTNYDEINDIDIVAGYLSSENPKWDSDDIEFELEQKYGSALFEDKIDLEEIDKDIYPDEYKEAVKINKEIDKAQRLLKRDALERRSELEELKSNIQLPIQGNKNSDDKEVQKGLTQEQIEMLQKNWLDAVERDVPTVNEFKFKLGDEDVSYKVTEDEQKQLLQKMRDFNAENYLVDRGWVNQDGTPNVKKITEDVYILENAEKMFKSGWTQAKEKAKMDIIGKDIKNINLGSNQQTFDVKGNNPYDFGDYVLSL